MVIMMVGVISIEVDFPWGFQIYVIFVVLSEKWLLGTSPYLEDILHTPEVPDGNHDGWDKIHWTGFCLRFPKIYNTTGCLVENCYQEPPHTWRMSSILLRFLIVILMAGVNFIEPDVDVDADADFDAQVMLSCEIRLLCSLMKKVNKQQTTNTWS